MWNIRVSQQLNMKQILNTKSVWDEDYDKNSEISAYISLFSAAINGLFVLATAFLAKPKWKY